MAVKAKTIEKEKKEWNASGAFDCLAVTSVQVYPFREGPSMGHIKGLASIVLNDQFLIQEYRSVCFPMARNLREHIENCVLEKYQASVV